MKKIDRRIIIVAALIFIVGLAFGLMKYLIAQKEDPKIRSVGDLKRYVKTEKVEYKTIQSSVEESGRIRSVREIDVVAEASGRIIEGKVSLKKGSEFRKGDLLFTIYKDEAALSLQSSKSQFQNSLANILPDVRMDFIDSENDFLIFFRSIDVEKELPSIPEIKNEKLKIFLASRNILSDYYSICRDELQLSRYSIYAPFNGTFTEVYLEAGAYSNMGGKVAHAIQTDRLEMEVPLRKVDAAWINIGDQVKVSRDGDPVPWMGKVVRKGKFLDDEFQRQSVFVSLSNLESHFLLNGEYLVANFPEYPVKDVMEMPRNAVFNSDEVFVVVEDRLQKRKIDIAKINSKTLLFRGLEKGCTLVTQALINVHEGTQVTTEVKQVSKKAGSSQGANSQQVKKADQQAEKDSDNKGNKKAGNKSNNN